MRKVFYLILLVFLVSSLFAQSKISKLHSKQKLDCSTCHECETPTKTNPCLALCPREKGRTKIHEVNEAPKVFEINNIHGEKDLYASVKFSHKTHAEMSEMQDGCSTCHHYNPPGAIVKCSFCHETVRKQSDIKLPDLKAAYHRQCMSCHESWEAESKCESCHALNSEYKSSSDETKIVKMSEPIMRPITKLYETQECKIGTKVTFHHNDHINLFGLQCTDCHQDESCQSCHNQKLEFKKVIDGSNHKRCATCHETEKKNKCAKCHSNKETKPFNHFVNTGFDINKYHSKISCSNCHKVSGKYSGLRANCQNCHDWDQDNFNHSITGLQLSDDHTDAECSDCHEDNNYSKPTCTNCHEEDEGFIVPQTLPGERVK